MFLLCECVRMCVVYSIVISNQSCLIDYNVTSNNGREDSWL